MPDSEMIQGSPEAANWTNTCTVNWIMTPNVCNQPGRNIGGYQGVKGKEPKNDVFGC